MDALMDQWFFLMVTWHPSSGIVLYQNKEPVGSSTVGKDASGLPINEDIPNFGVGRAVGSPGRVCGKLFINLLVVFKQFFIKGNILKIYDYFFNNSKYHEKPLYELVLL